MASQGAASLFAMRCASRTTGEIAASACKAHSYPWRYIWVQIAQIWMVSVLIGIEPTPAQ